MQALTTAPSPTSSQVVRHLHLDEAAGKRKLDAEKEQCKLAKQEEKRAVSSLRLNDL